MVDGLMVFLRLSEIDFRDLVTKEEGLPQTVLRRRPQRDRVQSLERFATATGTRLKIEFVEP